MVRDVETIRRRVQSFALRCVLRWRTGALEELVPRGLCAGASLRKGFSFQAAAAWSGAREDLRSSAGLPELCPATVRKVDIYVVV